MLLSEAAGLFCQQYDNARSRAAYRYVLSVFQSIVGDKDLREYTAADMDRWHLNLRQRGVSAATVAGRTKKIKAFWNWCVAREYVELSPVRFIRVKKVTRTQIDKAMPAAVVMRLIQLAKDERCRFLCARNTALLAVLIEYGLRASDAANMTISGIADDRFVTTVKGGKLHVLPLTPPVRALLNDWLDIRRALDPDPKHDLLWTNYRQADGARYQPISGPSISLIVRKYSQKLGHNYGAHSIRHWRGQSLADARVPPTVVQSILGHSNVSITLEYYYNQGDDRVAQVLQDYSALTPPKEGNVIRMTQTYTHDQENNRSKNS